MTKTRWMLAAACLAAMALPQSAAAEIVAVAPPTIGPKGAYTTAARAAARDDGCVSRNTIAFRETPLLRYRARHFGKIRCEVPTRIRCFAVLVETSSSPPRKVSEISARGRDRCRMASSFSTSDAYVAGTGFGEFFRYRLLLRKKRHRWAGTSSYCPKLKRDRRVLICQDVHRTLAPENHWVIRR